VPQDESLLLAHNTDCKTAPKTPEDMKTLLDDVERMLESGDYKWYNNE
jgi:hypothetical protein